MIVVDAFLKTETRAAAAAGLARDYLFLDFPAASSPEPAPRRSAGEAVRPDFPRLDFARAQPSVAMSCDAGRLADAARQSQSRRAFRPAFSAADWRMFSSFCVARRLAADQRVLVPGCADRSLRFVIEGSLWQEPNAGSAGSVPSNVISAGCIVGEEALFCEGCAGLDVRALEDSLVFELTWPRKNELMAAHPEIAFEMLRAAGAVIAARRRAPAPRPGLAVN
jgi:CRP/FNR family cyclic AMP-dependent transcriptional regulator